MRDVSAAEGCVMSDEQRRERVQRERVVVWSKTDKHGNETAFASVDMRAPEPRQQTSNPQEKP